MARRRNLTAFQSDGISGDLETRAEGHYRVPKRDLIVGLELLLQRRGLQIAAGMKFGPVLAREMAEMRVKITPSGNEQYGAWREGSTTTWCWQWRWRAGGARKTWPCAPYGEEAYWTGPRG